MAFTARKINFCQALDKLTVGSYLTPMLALGGRPQAGLSPPSPAAPGKSPGRVSGGGALFFFIGNSSPRPGVSVLCRGASLQPT